MCINLNTQWKNLFIHPRKGNLETWKLSNSFCLLTVTWLETNFNGKTSGSVHEHQVLQISWIRNGEDLQQAESYHTGLEYPWSLSWKLHQHLFKKKIFSLSSCTWNKSILIPFAIKQPKATNFHLKLIQQSKLLTFLIVSHQSFGNSLTDSY